VKALLFIITIFFAGITEALDPSKAVSQYLHDVWTTLNGLPQNSVQALVQTSDGYIWLGTQEGLVRFDGVRFTVFDKRNTPELKNHYILTLLEDQHGNLWIGTSGGGLTRYSNSKFVTYTKRDGLSDTYIRCLYEDRSGTLWIGTDLGGLNQYRNGKFKSYSTKDGLSHNFIRSIVEDAQGNLWIGTDGGGLNVLHEGKFSVFNTSNGLTNNFIGALLNDKDGGVWIGTIGGGLLLWKDGNFQSFTTKQGLSNDYVRTLLKDKNDTLWIGTEKGLNRYRDSKFESFSIEDGLLHPNVWSLFEDQEGSLWIGLFGGGLSRLKDGKFITYTRRQGMSDDDIWCLYGDPEGAIWIGTVGGGINRLKDGKVTVYTTRDGLAHDTVRALWMDSKGMLWAGTSGGGLSAFRDGKFKTYSTKDGLSNDFVRSIYEDTHGNLWIGTNGGGLNRFRDGKFTHYSTKNGFIGDFIRPIREDSKGNVWVAVESAGLVRIRNGEFKTFRLRDGLPDDRILSMHEDSEGVLWFGTLNSGLLRYKNEEWRRFTRKDGLFDDAVFQILEDSNGHFWMGSNRGIFRVALTDLNDFARGKIQTIPSQSYGIGDGMKTNECNGGSQPSGWKDRIGKLWFPTNNGLVVIDPDKLAENRYLPPVQIEHVSFDGQGVSTTGSRNPLRFPPGQGKLEFQYTALSFLVPEKVRFQYKLEGFDPQWIDAETRRTAFYTNIPPGSYTFRVIASNNDGIWNVTGAAFEFVLEPHFYQTPWFYALGIVAFIAIAVGAYRLRIGQMRAQFEAVLEERNRISREIHDTLTQDFTGVVLQLEAAEMTMQNPSEETKELIDRAREIARAGLIESRRFVRELRPAALEIANFPEAVLHVAKQAAAGTDLQVSADVSGLRRHLPAAIEDNLIRIVREACTNVVKHARAKNVKINLKYGMFKVNLDIHDDGRGFEVNNVFPKHEGGFGLTSMKERARKIRAKFSILSKPDGGTHIHVSVPAFLNTLKLQAHGPQKQ
jgi:ligand-binding sensor domain-containing protein/signal transduction histidine kinase